MTSTRQLKVSKLVQKELGEFFRRNAQSWRGAMISVTIVRISPDLGYAKVYLSIFAPGKDRQEIFNNIRERNKEVRKYLGDQLRQQVRVIPELEFFIDDSMDYAEKIDQLLRQ